MKNSKPKKVLYQVTVFSLPKQAGADEVVIQALINQGFKAKDLVESLENGRRKISVFVEDLKRAKKLERKVKALSLQQVRCERTCLQDADWKEKWKKDFKPFRLTSAIDVVPLWHAKTYRAGKRTPLFIDTTTAFGTGLHETTRFTAQLIEKKKGVFETFLDIGTGSGILSVCAKISGARKITAIDNDRECIRTSKKNLLVNGYKFDRIKHSDLKAFREKQKFDFVAANLITHDLVRMRRKIVSFIKPGGYLAVAGISVENHRMFKDSYREMPLRTLKIKKGRKWMAVLFKKE